MSDSISKAVRRSREGQKFRLQLVRAIEVYDLSGHERPRRLNDLLDECERDRDKLAALSAENARLRKLEAIVNVERSVRDGGWNESGLLAVGQALLTRAHRIAQLEASLARSRTETETLRKAHGRTLQLLGEYYKAYDVQMQLAAEGYATDFAALGPSSPDTPDEAGRGTTPAQDDAHD